MSLPSFYVNEAPLICGGMGCLASGKTFCARIRRSCGRWDEEGYQDGIHGIAASPDRKADELEEQ